MKDTLSHYLDLVILWSFSLLLLRPTFRWDLPRYYVYSNGRIVDHALDLDGFSQVWGDIVSFYIGCSFSVEEKLIEGGVELRNLKAGKDCSMFKTSLTLEGAGVFTGVQMVVSMRLIPKHLLHTAVLITAQYPDYHGAPIHIGDPLRIGVCDISKADFGDCQVAFKEDDVPVFWACGLSVIEAVASASTMQICMNTCIVVVMLILMKTCGYCHNTEYTLSKHW